MVSGLLVALVLAVIHATLVVHVRHTLQASAWEGARLASYYDTSLSDGIELTRRLIIDGVGSGYAQSVDVRRARVAGQPGVVVTVSAPFPAVGLWSLGGELRVEAAAALERPG